MWEYNYSDRNDWLEHSIFGNRGPRANHKYIKRNFINGRWVYEYADDLDDLRNKLTNKMASTVIGIDAGVKAGTASFKTRDTLNKTIGKKSDLKTVTNAVKDGYKAGKTTEKITNKKFNATDAINKATGNRTIDDVKLAGKALTGLVAQTSPTANDPKLKRSQKQPKIYQQAGYNDGPELLKAIKADVAKDINTLMKKKKK